MSQIEAFKLTNDKLKIKFPNFNSYEENRRLKIQTLSTFSQIISNKKVIKTEKKKTCSYLCQWFYNSLKTNYQKQILTQTQMFIYDLEMKSNKI